MGLSARPQAPRATWAAVALLLVCAAFPAAECSRGLRQVTDLAEAERLADLFLDEFLNDIGLDENGNPLLDSLFADDFGEEEAEEDSTPGPTPAPTPAATTPAPTVAPRRVVEVREVYPPDNPWNPICNVADVELPVIKVGDQTFHRTNKETFTMYVPPDYEIKAWAVVRTRNWSGKQAGIGAVKSKGLNFIAEVGNATNVRRTICGDWIYAEDGVYNWQVFADMAVFMDVYFTAREHLGNGAAAQLHGAFPQQKINIKASSAIYVGDSDVAAKQNVNIDLQGRGRDKTYVLDNRLRGDNVKVQNSILHGQQDYVLEKGAQRWGGGTPNKES